ncbi:hypothetical protein AYI68_g8271 [Smittium mucronatum]|uniref:Uncharacterized protein n=1 Tax=Smittium mucronatum TaxID=133383 RepID=A0A1R0GLC9_9FUNG|nr:hypothetical protein AYI68_g8271 [Smittium mucronatum]
MGNLEAMITQPRLENLHNGRTPNDLELESPFEGASSLKGVQALSAPFLQRNQSLKLLRQDILYPAPERGFRGETRDEVTGATKASNRPPSTGSPHGVQGSLGEARRQPVGPENRREWFPDPFQESDTEKTPSNLLALPGTKKRLIRFEDKDLSETKCLVRSATSTNVTPAQIQKKAHKRDPPEPDGRSVIISNKEGDRKSGEPQTRVLQQLILHSEKYRRVNPPLELRKLNMHLEEKIFKMESKQLIWNLVRRLDYMTSLDLKDALLHILIHKSCRKYLTFCWNETPEVEIFKGSSNTAWGIVIGDTKYYGLWSKSENTLKINFKGSNRSLVCPTAEINGQPIGSNLLRQYGHFRISQEILWDIISRATRECGTHVDALYRDQYQTTGNLRSISAEPCRCTRSTYFPDIVDPLTQGVFRTGQEIRGTRCRPLCIFDKQEGGEVLQLVSGTSSGGPECSEFKMFDLEEPLLLPTMELDFTGNPEDAERAHNYENNYIGL